MHDSAHTSKSIPFFLRLSRTPICSPAAGPPPARQIARFGLRPACPPPPCLATRRFAIVTPLLWTYGIRYFLLKPRLPAVYELDCTIWPTHLAIVQGAPTSSNNILITARVNDPH